MRRRGWIWWAVPAGIALCLTGSSWLGARGYQRYLDARLGLGGEFNAELPPHLALLTTGLGSFRGLFVNYLWHRAHVLQEQGRYFEANTLAQAITALLPDSAAVWSFHGWNMAYNISVATYTPQERWDWVRKGVDLLRQQGVRANPVDIRVYRELTWIFLHKIGERSDDMHWYYKQRMAYEWQELLGTPIDRQTREQSIAGLRAVAEAPRELDRLIQQQPRVADLLMRLRAIGHDPGESLVRAVGRVLMFRDSFDARLLGINPQEVGFDPRLAEIMDDPQSAPAFDALLASLRRRVLEDRFNMDPNFMLRLALPEEQIDGGFAYGVIDWRLPAAHALYWSQIGTRRVQQVGRLRHIDYINTLRHVRQALQQMCHFGRISFDPITRDISLMPDPRFFDAYEKAFLADMATVEDTPENRGVLDSFRTGHENLLLDASRTHYLFGDRQKGAEYYRRARDLYRDAPWNMNHTRQLRYALPLEEFIFVEIRESIGERSMSAVVQIVQGMLVRAFGEGLNTGYLEVYARQRELARRIHADYQARAPVMPYDVQQRMALLPFDELEAQTFQRFLIEPAVPLLERARIWNNAPPALQRRAYDHIAPAVHEQIEAGGGASEDAHRLFPAPPGMEAYRRRQHEETQSSDAPVPRIQQR